MASEIDLRGELPGIVYERRPDGIAVIRLARPERGNALLPAMQPVMRAIWSEVRDDPSIRVAIVTATGERHFCTGFDVAEAEGDEADDVFANRPLADAVHWSPHQNRVWKPVLCAVNGLCVGGGLHFVVDSDIVLASENAAFMDTHVNVGMVGALENVGLAKRLPLGSALRMTLMGRHYRMPARRAYELGWWTSSSPSPTPCCRRRSSSPVSCSRTRPRRWRSRSRRSGAASSRATAQPSSRPGPCCDCTGSTRTSKEGPRAFAEKRPPRWNPDPNARDGDGE